MLFPVIRDLQPSVIGSGGLPDNAIECRKEVKMGRIYRSGGFTLIELLITIILLGIALAIAAPSFSDLIKNSRLATETNDLLSDLAFARSESARRGKRVAICVSADGATCTTGSAWAGGRIVFVDAGTAGSVDTGDEILRYNQGNAGSNIAITASGFAVTSTSTLNYIQYRPNGATNTDAGGTFKICDNRSGNFGRIVRLAAIGRAALESSTASCP